jgi:hypothetical protein
MKPFRFLASVIFSLGSCLVCSTIHAGELGVNFSQEQWYDDWAAEFDATCVPAAADKEAETSDVIVQPGGANLAIGFRGKSFPGREDFFFEKVFKRRTGDKAVYRVEIVVNAARWHRDNHAYHIEVSRDGGSMWEPFEPVVVTEYSPPGNTITQAVDVAADDVGLAVRVVVTDTNDWQEDGSRIQSFYVNFNKVKKP